MSMGRTSETHPSHFRMGHGTAWGKSEFSVLHKQHIADIKNSLAYHEMRLVLASMLLHFDMELCDDKQDWMHQENYIMWVRKPLWVRLKPVQDA
jgi:hypothetical protein